MPLIKDTALIGMSHVAAAVSLLGVQVILARSLPADQFGALLLAQAFTALIEGLVVARAGEVAMYTLGHAWLDQNKAAGAARALQRSEMKWSVLACAAVVFASPLLGYVFGVPAYWYAVLALAIPLQTGFGVSKALFIVSNRVRMQAWFDLLFCMAIVTVVGLGVWSAGVNGFLAATVLLAGLKTVVAKQVTARWLPAAGPDVGSDPGAGAVSPASLARNAFSNIANQADVLVMGLFAPKEAVALYKVSRTLSSIPGRAAGPLWAALRPRLVRHLGAGSLGEVRREVSRSALLLGGVGIVAAPAAWVLCEPTLALMYGPHYIAASSATLILAAGNWVLAGLTGWLATVAIMSVDKRVTVGLYAVLAASICAGALAAGGGLVTTATAVACAMVFTSGLAWAWLTAVTK